MSKLILIAFFLDIFSILRIFIYKKRIEWKRIIKNGHIPLAYESKYKILIKSDSLQKNIDEKDNER